MNTKYLQTLFAAVTALAIFPALPARAEEPQPGAPAPEATATQPARTALPPPARRVALPKANPDALARVMPRGPKFDKLPPDEKEHIRKMAEFRIARDEAEKELLELDKAVDVRRAEILAENEDAKALSEKIAALQAEFDEATNALEKIYRADEKLVALAEKIEPARLIVENSQYELNQEVAAAMQKRMAAMRKAYEEANPPPPPPQDEEKPAEDAPSAPPPDVIDPKDAPPGTIPGVSPDVKPPLDPAKRLAPPAKPAGK